MALRMTSVAVKQKHESGPLVWLALFPRFLWDRLWLLVPILAIPALLPFYTEGLPRSYDGGLHLLRISLLDQYIRQGVIFPRWAPDLLLGQGYPVFSFYAPGTYYLVEAFHLLGLDFYNAFIASFALLIIGAGIGMYLFARDLFGTERPGAALVAAVAYLYSPYLLTNVFIRGAIAEAGAQTLLPWIFWGMRRLLYAKQPAHYMVPVALGISALALTHTISLLFVPPVLLGFIVIHWWAERRWPTLRWTIFTLLLAMGISAFFWLPLLWERQYLATTAYEIAQTIWLPGSVWTWENFLDRGWVFNHTFERPIRLGLVQTVLAVLGFVVGWRRQRDWLFFGVVALVSSGLISAWALPLWLNSDILSVAQFTWRLLSILSLPLALFAGGLVWRARPQWLAILLTIGLVLLVIWAHKPRLQWMDVFADEAIDLSLPVFLQFEVDKDILDGGGSNSSIQEFRPRWADETLELELPDRSVTPLAITNVAANAFALEAQINTPNPATLRFQQYYFPGWQLILDGQTELTPYPTTNLGLLTVDLPAGTHTLQLRWQGTDLQRWSGALTIFSLVILICAGWWRGRVRWWLLPPVAMLAIALTAGFAQPTPQPLTVPTTAVDSFGLQMLGYRSEVAEDGLYLYPYWQIIDSPPEAVQLRWLLQNQAGETVVDSTVYPYYNSYRASNFPAGTLVDDAYRLPLPPSLPAGTYQLGVLIGEEVVDLLGDPLWIGEITIPQQPPARVKPRHEVDAQIGQRIELAGFDLQRGQQLVNANAAKPTVVRPGDYLRYRLYWQALRPLQQNYHGFVHLVNVHGWPLVQEDQLPGPFFHPPLLWDTYHPQTDTYLLRIPEDAPSGLYWPATGMYNFATMQRLPFYTTDTAGGINLAGYEYRLPPVKVVNSPTVQPAQPLAVELGTIGHLIGYDLSLPTQTIRAGESFTTTLYYRSEQTTTVDYTRFLHFYDPERGMAAQHDGLPQAGVNPTWSWFPDEVIVDPIQLTLPLTTTPGTYTLYHGFYDAAADAVRLPLTQNGARLLDDRVPLTTLTVVP
jgi:hypothetical protein